MWYINHYLSFPCLGAGIPMIPWWKENWQNIHKASTDNDIKTCDISTITCQSLISAQKSLWYPDERKTDKIFTKPLLVMITKPVIYQPLLVHPLSGCRNPYDTSWLHAGLRQSHLVTKTLPLTIHFLGAITIYQTINSSKNSNIMKLYLSITFVLVIQSFWNFTQSTAVILPCCV